MSDETFTVDAARRLMPDVVQHAADLVPVRADLAELRLAVQAGRSSPLGGLPELKALEARLHEGISWFPAHGIQVKGIAPLLLDFPSDLDGEPVLLCWLEGEEALDWYHHPALGFMGRRRLPG